MFNFAQGAMVLFAALAMVRLMECACRGRWRCASRRRADHDRRRLAIERLVLRQLVNQAGLTLFMATLGISYVLDGFGQALFGSDIYKIDLGMPKDPLILFEILFPGGMLVNEWTFRPRRSPGVLVDGARAVLPEDPIGRALRAVADDHQAAQSIGIPLDRIWLIVWSVAGWWRWSPASSGAASSACSSRSRWWR